MKKWLFLLLLPALAQAADYQVTSATSTINCNTFCGGGVCQPGDTLTMDGGSRGRLELQNCTGASGNHIVLRNNPTDSSRTTINTTGTGTAQCIELDDVEYFTVDGTQGWDGAPSGVCGVDTDLTEGRTQCGIKCNRQSGNINSFIQLADESTRFTIKGVEIDGNKEGQTACCGIGLAMYDRSYDCEGGNGTVDTKDCTTWREDVIIENNYLHDTYHEGMYAGPNYMNDISQYDLPHRNWTIRYNLVEDTGWGGLQLKTAIQGTNVLHHNIIRRAGQDAAEINDFGHAICVQGDGNSHFHVYNNLLEDCGGTALAFRSQYVTSDVFSSMNCEAYNNIIVRAGFILNQHGVSGTIVNNTDPPTMNCQIYNNTIVDASSRSVDDGNVSGTWAAIENILCGAGLDGSVTDTNNNKSACTSQGFTSYVGDDFSLTAGSSNVDAGTASPGDFPSDDYAGVSRPQGAAHDIGAYEFESAPAPDPDPQRGGFTRTPNIIQ